MHNSAGYYISTIYRHLQIYLNNQFAGLGFGSGQYLFFNTISHFEGITQKELSSRLAIDKATTAKAVKKLVELGYIRAVPGKEDRRYQNLYLTGKGMEVLPEVRSILKNTRSLLQDGLSDSEIELSIKLMDRMLTNITDEVQQHRSKNVR